MLQMVSSDRSDIPKLRFFRGFWPLPHRSTESSAMHGPFTAPVHKDTKTHMEKLINAIQVQLMLRLGCWGLFFWNLEHVHEWIFKAGEPEVWWEPTRVAPVLGRYNLDANDWTLFQTSAGWDAALAETQLIVLGEETQPLTLRGCDLVAEMVHETFFIKWYQWHYSIILNQSCIYTVQLYIFMYIIVWSCFFCRFCSSFLHRLCLRNPNILWYLAGYVGRSVYKHDMKRFKLGWSDASCLRPRWAFGGPLGLSTHLAAE